MNASKNHLKSRFLIWTSRPLRQSPGMLASIYFWKGEDNTIQPKQLILFMILLCVLKPPGGSLKLLKKTYFCVMLYFFFQKDSPSPSLSFPGLVYSFHSSSALYQIVSPITFKYLHKLLTKTNICKKVVFVNKIPGWNILFNFLAHCIIGSVTSLWTLMSVCLFVGRLVSRPINVSEKADYTSSTVANLLYKPHKM